MAKRKLKYVTSTTSGYYYRQYLGLVDGKRTFAPTVKLGGPDITELQLIRRYNKAVRQG